MGVIDCGMSRCRTTFATQTQTRKGHFEDENVLTHNNIVCGLICIIAAIPILMIIIHGLVTVIIIVNLVIVVAPFVLIGTPILVTASTGLVG